MKNTSEKMEYLVKKSIRLSPELVDYIEQQSGRDFTKKLSSLLEESMKGESERRHMIEMYDQQLALKRDRLKDLSDYIYGASVIADRLSKFYRSAVCYCGDVVENNDCKLELPEDI